MLLDHLARCDPSLFSLLTVSQFLQLVSVLEGFRLDPRVRLVHQGDLPQL